jgi:hypothetical protein
MKDILLFAFKCWLTAILIGAFLLSCLSFINAKAGDLSVLAEYAYFFFIFILEAAIFSIPILLVIIIITGPISKRNWTYFQKKLYLGLTVLVAYSLTFCIVFKNTLQTNETLIIWPTYAIGIMLSVWIYKLPVSLKK